MFTSVGSLCQINGVRHLHNTRTMEKVLNMFIWYFEDYTIVLQYGLAHKFWEN